MRTKQYILHSDVINIKWVNIHLSVYSPVIIGQVSQDIAGVRRKFQSRNGHVQWEESGNSPSIDLVLPAILAYYLALQERWQVCAARRKSLIAMKYLYPENLQEEES